METTVANQNKQNRGIGWWAAAVTVLACAWMLFMSPVQDTGDDAMLAWLMARGSGSVAPFISPYLSIAESFLFRVAPQIPWWSVTLFAGGGVLLYVLIRLSFASRTWLTGILAALLSFMGVWLAVVRTLNFTRSAAAFALSGLLLILWGIDTEKRGKSIVGLVLFLFGCAIRWESGCLQVPFFLLCLVVLIYRDNDRCLAHIFAHAKKKKYLAPTAGVILMLLLIPLGTKLFSSQNPAYKEYLEYTQARSNIVDYLQDYPTWEEGSEAYIAAGLTDETDWDLLTNCAFITDRNTFSLETLQNVAELKHSNLSVSARLLLAVKKNYWAVLDGSLKWLCAAAVLTMLLLFRKKAILPMLFSYGGAGLMLLWAAYRGRMVLRVWEPTVFSATVAAAILCCLLGKIQDEKKIFRSASLTISAAAIVVSGMGRNLISLQYPTAEWDRDPVMVSRGEQMAADAGNLYFLNWSYIHNPPTPAPFGLWEAAGTNIPENFFALSNWDSISPYNQSKLEALGIDNMVEALLERTDVKSDYDSRISHYLNTHYGHHVSTTAVDSFADTLPIVQYTSLIDVTGAAAEPNGKVEITHSGIVENYHACWLRVAGTVAPDVSDDAAYYFNVRLDGRNFTCRIAPDAQGNFSSDVLLDDENTVWELAEFFTYTADGKLNMFEVQTQD